MESTLPTLRGASNRERACYSLSLTDMNQHPKLAGLVALLPLAVAAAGLTGCAARSAPFDQMDRAQITVLRLSAPQAAAPQTAIPTIPGVPPELAAMGQAALQGLQNVVPGLGNALPGLIPGAAQPQQALPQFKGYGIMATSPVPDNLKDELLDIFGHESSFSGQAQPCFSPGMGVVFQRQNGPQVELLISLSCNQVKMDGARWPFQVNGFTPETSGHLRQIYEKLWGPVPPGA